MRLDHLLSSDDSPPQDAHTRHLHPEKTARPSWSRTGAVAQLGEHLLCKQGVVGSIPISSTKGDPSDARSGCVPAAGFERLTQQRVCSSGG